jgi:hypothetical protein
MKMNARMSGREFESTRKLQELREAQAIKDRKEFENAEKTGFLKVGNGKSIHIASKDGLSTLCRSEGEGSAQVRFAISPLSVIEGPATCKRCLKQLLETGEKITKWSDLE